MSVEGTDSRVLAFVPPALDDEPLDGYLEHLAHRLRVPLRVVYSHLGVTRTSPLAVAGLLGRDGADRGARATGWSIDDLDDMTLRRYENSGLLPTGGRPGGGPGPWLRRRGVRYCPACLRERDLRWRLSWYLQWTYVCADHATLLDVACPACGRPPRTRRRGHPVVGQTAPTAGGVDLSRPGHCTCPVVVLAHADLTRPPEHAVLDQPVPPVILDCQRLITERIEAPSQVQYLGLLRSNAEWIHDLAALTRLLLVNLPPDQIPAAYLDVLTTRRREGRAEATDRTRLDTALRRWEPHLGLSAFTAPAARFAEASASRVTFALAASVATCILTTAEPAVAARMLSTVLPDRVREAAARQSRSRGISWPLARALWLADHRTPPAQTRAIRLGSDRFRPDGRERVPLDPARIPARPWPTVRAALGWSAPDPFTGLTATVALLTAASATPLSTACETLGHAHLARRVAHETRKFFAALALTDHDPFDDILRLHDAITAHAVPIDYERRRRAFPRPAPLKQRTVVKIAHELQQRPTPRLSRFMSWWVYEQLTGNDVLLQPDLLELPGAIRSVYGRQRARWDAEPPRGLLRRAEHALLVNRIDEPITWSPVQSADRTWRCPPANPERQLDWSHRTRRASSRPAASAIEDLTLDQIVLLARSGQSTRSDRLAVMLARFQAVAMTGSITQAARLAGISQPTMSVAMRNLETEIATPLLQRGHHAISLTPQGVDLSQLLRRRPLTALVQRAASNECDQVGEAEKAEAS